MPRETPEWAKMTPHSDGAYELQVISGGDCLEIVELLRDEYISLKRIVAEWRGIAVTGDICGFRRCEWSVPTRCEYGRSEATLVIA